MKRKEVVVFLLKTEGDTTKVLLGLKLRKVGLGKRNGYGGGVKKRESTKAATVRELSEELGVLVSPEDLQEKGFLNITVRKMAWRNDCHDLHIFTLRQWQGGFKEDETEGIIDPQWFDINALPDDLIDSDKAWLPYILHNNKVQGSIIVRVFGAKVTTFNFDVIY